MEENGLNQNPATSAESKPNLLFAILAAIGLALVGSVLYGVLYYVGYIAWIASYVTIIASAWGYKHFNKKMDWKGYLTVAIASIAAVIVSMFISLTLVVAKAYNCSFIDALKNLFTLLDTHDKIRSYVIRDGALTGVFTLLGLLSYFFYEKRLQMAKKSETQAIESSKQEEKKETPVAPAKTEEAVAEQKQVAQEKPVVAAKVGTSASAEKKLTAVPAELKDKPAKKPASKKTQTTSANKPLMVKPVVSNKTTTAKKTTTKTTSTSKPTTKKD